MVCSVTYNLGVFSVIYNILSTVKLILNLDNIPLNSALIVREADIKLCGQLLFGVPKFVSSTVEFIVTAYEQEILWKIKMHTKSFSIIFRSTLQYGAKTF